MVFGSKNVKYDLQAFNEMLEARPHYKKLVQTFGERNTLYVTGMIFNQYKGTGDVMEVEKSRVASHGDQLDAILRFEYERINARKFEISRLLALAKQGRLSWKLQRNKLPRRQYFAPQPHLAGFSESLEQAFKWITHSWTGSAVAGEKIRTALLDYGTPPANGCPLGMDYRIIKDVHSRITSNAPAYRPPSIQPVKYPSSVGGMYLLQHIFQMTSNIRWPEQGDEKWVDFALFFLGAIVTVQGFSDGNKRAGRTAYGIIMTKSGVDFAAPSVAFENELYNM